MDGNQKTVGDVLFSAMGSLSHRVGGHGARPMSPPFGGNPSSPSSGCQALRAPP